MSASTPSQERVEIIEKKELYRGYFRLDEYVLRHRTYAGEWTKPVNREIFGRGHSVAILLYDPDRDEVGLIEQFRAGALAAGWNPWLIEIVAGSIGKGESPDAVALREIQEETGTSVDQVEPIFPYLASPGGISETISLYCARIDSSKFGGVHGLPEESEDIRAFAVPADEAISWVASRRITNAATIIALQWLALNRKELCQKWGVPRG